MNPELQAQSLLEDDMLPAFMITALRDAVRRMLMGWTFEHHVYPQVLYRCLIYIWLESHQRIMDPLHFPEFCVRHWTIRSEKFGDAYVRFLDHWVIQSKLEYNSQQEPEAQWYKQATEWRVAQSVAASKGQAMWEDDDTQARLPIRCAEQLIMLREQIMTDSPVPLPPQAVMQIWPYLLAEMRLGADERFLDHFALVLSHWDNVYPQIVNVFIPALMDI